jgi:hypothetical protein
MVSCMYEKPHWKVCVLKISVELASLQVVNHIHLLPFCKYLCSVHPREYRSGSHMSMLAVLKHSTRSNQTSPRITQLMITDN